MKYFNKLLISSVLLACSQNLYAQQTGSYNSAITFNNQQRILSIYVPTNYDSLLPARLVVGLHGMGDASTNYRNVFVNSGFNTYYPNTILVCPDGGNDNASSFYVPVGDEAIIQASIDYISTNYNIDTTNVFLQGFSLGGSAALKYGLDNPTKFKGLILNTPAVQGVKEANNLSPLTQYAYQNAPQIPIYITLGTQDDLYLAPIDSAYVKLVENNGKVKFHKFNMGHTMPGFSVTDYVGFFETPYSNGLDLSVAKIKMPVRVCDNSVTPQVLIQNNGNDTITSLKLKYGTGVDAYYTWTGTLAQHEHQYISLPAYTSLTNGNNTMSVVIDSVNQLPDSFLAFNEIEKEVQFQSTPLTIPYLERFNDSSVMDTWAMHPSGDFIMPLYYEEFDKSLYSLNSIFVFDNSGTREEVLSPNLNLTNLASTDFLNFDVDYNYVNYSAAIFGVDTVFADSLEVFVSTDCGVSYQSIFKKGGVDLTNHVTPLQDPLSLNDMFIVSDSTIYRTHSVDISAYNNQPNVHFKFSYISSLGGYIYIDNVSVGAKPTHIKNIDIATFNIYPNPANEYFMVTAKNVVFSAIELYDMQGKMVKKINLTGLDTKVPVADLAAGNYLLKCITNEGVGTKKVVITK